jgi:acylphosphatase
MKLKITIIGPKVHDVGYRYFLMSMAMANRIRMFEAHNIEGDVEEEVLVLVDGGEQEIKAFRALTQTKRPGRAEVSKVVIEDCEGEVMKIGEYAQFCATVQMNKAIPLLLSMNDNLQGMNDNLQGMNDNLQGKNDKMDGLNDKMNDVIGRQDSMIVSQEETTSEIRGLRDDLAIRNNAEWQVRVEKDIRVIKSKLGIR